MRTVIRATAVLAAAGLAVPLWGVPSASAATVSEPASIGAYFYRGGITTQGLPAEPPAPVPNVTADNADGVSPGNLAVAASGGQEDKVSFLAFTLAELPLDATVEKAVLTVPLVPSSTSDIVYGAAPERIRACKAGDQGFFGEDGQSTMLAPDRLCDELASEPATLSPDGKAYVFDVTALAASWAEADDGLALTVAEGSEASSFQVVFAPSDQARLAYSFTAPPALDDVTPGGLDVPADPGTGFDSGSADLGGTPAPSDDLGGFGTADAPVVSMEAPAPDVLDVPAPETAPAGGEPLRTTAVASSRPSEVLDPSIAFWAAGLGFAALLALLSLIMGDPRVPVATTSPSRLSRALSDRQRPATL